MGLLSHEALVAQAAELGRAPWLVDGLIRRSSLGIIAGFPKCGKTWLALQMCHAVASGSAFLNRIPTSRARVLFIAVEDSPQLLAERSQALLKGHQAPSPAELSFLIQNVRIDTSAGLAACRSAVRESRAELVILDTLNRSHALNENLQSHASKLIAALDSIRREFGCALLATHHLGKAARDGQDGRALRGSSVLHAGLENSLYLWAGDAPGRIKVSAESKFASPSAFSYVQTSDGDAIRLVHADALPKEPVIGNPGAGVRLIRRLRRKRRW